MFALWSNYLFMVYDFVTVIFVYFIGTVIIDTVW